MNHNDDYDLTDVIREQARPLEPIPTGVEPRLAELPEVRAVLFDVYGTLLISSSGDVGTARRMGRGDAFAQAMQATGIPCEADPEDGVHRLIDAIRAHHDAHESADYPEVDIVRVWEDVVRDLEIEMLVPEETEPDDETLRRLALEYEIRVNPAWPMPGCEQTLDLLANAGITLGLVSNAQFFTPVLFTALLGRTLSELGVDPELRFYSWQHLQAKPGRFLYELARNALKEQGIEAEQVLYVGNDVLNDVWPAAAVGFRTALFAGDERSLRLREDDDRVDGVEPDVVLTGLGQLPGVLGIDTEF